MAWPKVGTRDKLGKVHLQPSQGDPVSRLHNKIDQHDPISLKGEDIQNAEIMQRLTPRKGNLRQTSVKSMGILTTSMLTTLLAPLHYGHLQM